MAPSLSDLLGLVLHDNSAIAGRIDSDAVLVAIDNYGIYSVHDLDVVLADATYAAELKATICPHYAPPMLMVMLKRAILSLKKDENPGVPVQPPQAQVQPPDNAVPLQTATFTACVKAGAKVLVHPRVVTVPSATQFGGIVRGMLFEAKPTDYDYYVTQTCAVSLYPSNLNGGNPNERSAVETTVTAATLSALGMKYVVFGFAPRPVHTCAPKPPSANTVDGFAAMRRLQLPPRHATDADHELPFEKALFNAIVTQCDDEQLGVVATDVESQVDHRGGARRHAAHHRERGFVRRGAREIQGVRRQPKEVEVSRTQQNITKTATRLRGMIDGRQFMRCVGATPPSPLVRPSPPPLPPRFETLASPQDADVGGLLERLQRIAPRAAQGRGRHEGRGECRSGAKGCSRAEVC